MVNPIPSSYSPADFTEGVFVIPYSIPWFCGIKWNRSELSVFSQKNKVKTEGGSEE